MLASLGVLSQVSLLGLEKNDACLCYGAHVLQTDSPMCDQVLRGCPDSLGPTPHPAGWYPGDPLVCFLRWFSILSETLVVDQASY